jgi:hypothetical protein
MKTRSVHPTRTGDLSTKYRLKIVDDPSSPGTHEAEQRLISLLRDLADQPTLLMCGPEWPQKVSFYHNGTAWVLEAEADGYTQQST